MLPWIENYIAELINKYPDSEYLLPEHAEQYQSCPSTITKRMKTFLETDLGIDTAKRHNNRTQRCSNLDFHSLRHTFCTLAGVAGVPITVVQSIVGHMTPRMTAMYSRHVDEQEKLKYINIFGRALERIPMDNHLEQNLLPASVEAEREQLAELAKTLPLEKVKSLLEMVA
jgi:integrase